MTTDVSPATTSATGPAAATTGSASSAPSSSGTSSTGSDASGSAITAIDSNFNMFLKLLTTQLKNQDPLNPMDSSQFAVQLATFSGVEQQAKTNTLLESIAGQLGQSGMSQLAGWIGMEVRSTKPAAFDGKPITLAPAPDSNADTTVLVVKDANGTRVASETIPVSSDTIQWDGKNAGGNTLPKGNYTFELQNYQNGQLIGTDPVESYSRVVEAQTGTSGTVLVLDSGSKVDASKVTALRAAQ
jgi:flagellar basal-body rod modification protein FlgD